MPVTTDIFFLRGVPHCNMWGSSWKCGTPSHRLADVFWDQNWFFFQSDTPKKIWSAFISFLTQQTQPFQSIQPCSARAGEDFFSRCSLRPGWSCCKKPRKTLRPWACNFFAHPRKSITRNHAYHANRRIRGTGGQKCWFLNQKKQSTSQENVASKKKILWLHMRHSQNRKEQTTRYIYIYNYIYIYIHFLTEFPILPTSYTRLLGHPPKNWLRMDWWLAKLPTGCCRF